MHSVSLAHAWSTGPTAAFIFDLVGLHIDTTPAEGDTKTRTVADGAWRFTPSILANVYPVRGGFRTALGTYESEWTYDPTNQTLSGWVATPEGTTGNLVSKATALWIDGKIAYDTKNATAHKATVRDGDVWLALSGGKHNVVLHI